MWVYGFFLPVSETTIHTMNVHSCIQLSNSIIIIFYSYYSIHIRLTFLRSFVQSWKHVTHRKPILNFVKSVHMSIVIIITLFRLIWSKTEFCLVSNQSEKFNWNPNPKCFIWSLHILRIFKWKPEFVPYQIHDLFMIQRI